MTDLVPAPAPAPFAAQVETLRNVSKWIASTTLVPKALRGKPEEVFAVLLYGDALGLHPMIALDQIYVIEGRVSMSAELLAARVYAAGGRLEVLEHSATRCVVKGSRRDGSTLSVTWTIEDARKAGLIRDGSPWTKYPRAMLLARARAELARALFPEATLGLGFTPDEIAESGDDEVLAEYVGRVDAETGEILEAEVVEDEEDAVDLDWRAAAAKARGDRTQQTGDTP